MARLRQLSTVAALFCVGCVAGPALSPTATFGQAPCRFDVRALKGTPLVLDVVATCAGYDVKEYRLEPGVADYLSHVATLQGRPLSISERGLRLPPGANGLRYRVRLGDMAKAQADIDGALAVGRSVLAPGYSWLLTPSGVSADTPVIVHYAQGPDGWGFTTGLATHGEAYQLRAGEIRVATFAVFGEFDESELSLPGIGGGEARLELITLDADIAVDSATVRRWVRETARAVSDFYGGFPVQRAMLALAPVPGRRGVLRGKVLPESNPGIALLIGERSRVENLYADWILTHELFHLGFPSFAHEGKWLDEGIATYFEPLIRARQGWLSERDVWAEFFTHMHKGLSVLERDGLQRPRGVRGMYWAGATVCLLADIQVHQASDGEKSLQQGVRALLRAGGDATRVWRLAEAVATIDRELGGPVLANLGARYAKPGSSVPLERVFRELGVIWTGSDIRFDDTAPLAPIRRSITRGQP